MRELDPAELKRLAAMQRQLSSQLQPVLRAVRDMGNVLADVRLPQLLISDEVWRRLQFPIPTFTSAMLRGMTFPAATIAADAVKSLQPAFDAAAAVQAHLEDWGRALNQILQPHLDELVRLAGRVGKVAAVVEAFHHYGLWLAPSMTEDLVRRVLELRAKEAPPGAVRSMISRRYAMHNWSLLEQAVISWERNPYLADRMDTLSDALDAHRRGQYTLSIPALALLVEGVCADYVKANGIVPKVDHKTREIVVSALKATPCRLADVTEYAAVQGLIEYVENQMYAYVDFDREYRRLRREKTLRGHAVRHGRQRRHATRMNSLQLFLVIDVLSLLK